MSDAAGEDPRQRAAREKQPGMPGNGAPAGDAGDVAGDGSAGDATNGGGGGQEQPNGLPVGRRPEDFHRPSTRMERLRGWVEGLPKKKLYVILLLGTWLVLTLLTGVDPRQFLAGEARSYEAGSVAERDVYASRGVSFDDPVATEDAESRARDAAGEVYGSDEGVPERRTQAARSFFAGVREIRASEAPDGEKATRIAESAPFYLPGNASRLLVSVEDRQVDDAERYVVENLEELYRSTTVADDEVPERPAAVVPLSEGRERLSEAARQDASGELGVVVETVSRGFLQPNYVVDRAATEEARDRSAAGVEPVRGEIQRGERVVARGEVVDEGDLSRLEALGVVADQNPWTAFLGTALVVGTEMWITLYFLERFGKRILKGKVALRVVLAALLLILFTVLARVCVFFGLPAYLIPLPGLSLLGTILLGPRLMFLMVVISSVNLGIIAGNDFFVTAALLLTSGFAIYVVLRHVGARTELLWAGLLVAAVSGVVALAVGLIGGGGLREVLFQGGLGLANGLLSLMLAMVLLPLLENAFNVLTPMKLLELSDPGSPLLQKLLRGAPGTFSHSMQVGNLAENAAERIGADALLARVGAYYHDIGKLEHPGYFIENQISKANPHATLTPTLSAKIIKRHVKDGLLIGRQWNLPDEILDLIGQHHGTTRIEYFYRKALENSLKGGLVGPEVVREGDFRYPGPKPRTKEAGILMIADSVEATVKSLEKPTPKRIEDIVNGTIKHKLDDGQFDECQLTMQEIHASGEAIREALIGFLGPRIEYPGSGGGSSPTVRKTPKSPPGSSTAKARSPK